jgi:hypothetical protein
VLQLIVAVLLVIAGFFTGIYYHKKGNVQNMKEVAYYRDIYLRKQGATVFVKGAEKSYDLRSFDGGEKLVCR